MPNSRALFKPSNLAASLAIGLCLAAATGAFASGGHAGLPAPTTELAQDEVAVPFVLPQEFPVPVVEVMLNGDGPWRLAVDTAMGGTVLLRQELAASLGLPVVGKAMVGDSSDSGLKPADLVRIYDSDYPRRLRLPSVQRRVRRNLERIRDLDLILDFNLRALERKAPEPYVSAPILALAGEMGIAAVPGDDSHGVANVGRYMTEGIRSLETAGFDTAWRRPA